MDIREWPLDKIMQLPDCCFGRRWLVPSSRRVPPDTEMRWIVDMPIPERIVLWSLAWSGYKGAAFYSFFKVALGDHDPATVAEFNVFERLFKGDLDDTNEEGAIYMGEDSFGRVVLRMPIEMAGRRFVIDWFNGHTTYSSSLTWWFEMSSIPREVPDWLISGAVRNQ